MDVHSKTAVLKQCDLFFVPSFSDNFKTACDGNIIHKRAKNLLFQYFIRELAKAAFSHQLTANKKNHRLEGKLTTY